MASNFPKFNAQQRAFRPHGYPLLQRLIAGRESRARVVEFALLSFARDRGYNSICAPDAQLRGSHGLNSLPGLSDSGCTKAQWLSLRLGVVECRSPVVLVVDHS